MAIARDQPFRSATVAGTGSRMGSRDVDAYIEKLKEGVTALQKARATFAVPDDIDSYSPFVAQLFAYELFLESHIYTYLDDLEASRVMRDLPSGPALIQGTAGCPSIEWSNQRSSFPATEQGFNGAVFYGFDLDANGRVTNLKVLSEVPEARFGAAVESFTKKWRADVKGVPEACRQNLLMRHLFFTQI
ncbi:MAG: energy transducer TonB [Parvularcula sp.]|jgi:hypothetical protein|nr:energy transducer TonB [Parvularcula sp.]